MRVQCVFNARIFNDNVNVPNGVQAIAVWARIPGWIPRITVISAVANLGSCSCCVPSERRHAQNPSSSMLQACSTNEG